MQQYIESEDTARLDFARLATKHFEENPADVTFTKNGLVAGEWMALRWGMSGDCVVVIKIHEYEPIINYCQFIAPDKAKKAIELDKLRIDFLQDQKGV